MMSVVSKEAPVVSEHNNLNQETKNHGHSREREEDNRKREETEEQTLPSRTSRRSCEDGNDKIINEVIVSLSAYSTPPCG